MLVCATFNFLHYESLSSIVLYLNLILKYSKQCSAVQCSAVQCSAVQCIYRFGCTRHYDLSSSLSIRFVCTRNCGASVAQQTCPAA